MTDPVGEPQNVEGAPTLVYEVWDWHYSAGRVPHWRFIGYRVLSLRQVQKYLDFGYHVERSHSASRDVARGEHDRGYTPPLFPRLGSTSADSGHGVD